MEGARQQLTGLLEISPIEAGLATVGWLTNGITGEAAAEAARARNVEVIALRRFHRGAMARDGLQLGFAAVNPREIRRGITELARILDRRADRSLMATIQLPETEVADLARQTRATSTQKGRAGA
jgi:GntR family transcriptional regulator/MocR family aminotransferase